MADMQEDKLELFEQEIMQRAQAQRDAILKEAEQMKRDALGQEENRLLDESFHRIQSQIDEIKTENIKEISRETLALKKELFKQREQYLSQMIAEARVELGSFAKSERYEAYFLGKIRELAASWKLEGSTIKVRPEDTAFEPRIREIYGDCAVEADAGAVSRGGAVLVNRERGVEVDLSLDAALAGQREWFYRGSNFNFD